MKTFKSILVKSAMAVSALTAISGYAQASEASCDPVDVEETVEIANLSRVEINRPATGSFKLEVTPTLFSGETAETPEQNDTATIKAHGIEVIATGGSCTALIQSLKVYRGDRDGWLSLRTAGRTLFLPNSFRSQFSVEKIELGIDLVLFQKAFCDIKINTVTFKDTHPFLRPQPFPDPQC